MKKTVLAAALSALSTLAVAQPGYVMQPNGGNVMSGYGLCVRTGFWTQDMAAEPCDSVPRAATPAPVMAAPAPAPMARPAPQAPVAAAPQPPTQQPAWEKVALSADVLFEFNSAMLKPEGRQRLDEIAMQLQDARMEEIAITGHTDRIGSPHYNLRLSQERAQAVTDYLRSRGPTQNYRVVARGESAPVTGASCSNLGRESGANRRLVECLQPDRRVEIQLQGMRLAAPTGTSPASTGGTQPAGMRR
ncbi:MAG: OmpA family protein [Betaproteobacteria bacterium]